MAMKIEETKNREVDRQENPQGTWESSTAEEARRNDEREFDIGSAPGGCYNQRGVNESQRPNVDDDIVPPARGSRIDRDLDRQL